MLFFFLVIVLVPYENYVLDPNQSICLKVVEYSHIKQICPYSQAEACQHLILSDLTVACNCH